MPHRHHTTQFERFVATLRVDDIDTANLVHDENPVEPVVHAHWEDIDVESDLIRFASVYKIPFHRTFTKTK